MQAQVVQFEDSQLFMEFDSSAKILEIQDIVKAHFPGNKIPQGDPDSGRIRFESWSGHEALNLPFRYVAIGSLCLVLIGATSLVRERGNHAA